MTKTCHVSQSGAEQAVAYVGAQQAATGMVPTQKKLLFERFFDESGGMQLVIHAPFGTRINRAWGLAMRKRFCRTFDFELQASADDNGIVLSFGAQHSFPLEQMFRLVPSRLARDVLVQALLAVPFFGTRWRWNVTRALQMKRAMKGKRVPPFLQRMRAEDLLTAVFPAQTACQENVVGDIPLPDHPLIRQTVDDCLFEASDIEGWLTVLRDIEADKIELVGLDSREPSPFAHQLLNANPYAFLDDAPLEERRARAVATRRTLSAEALRDLGRLDPEAVALVKSEAWPLVRDADELHDVLLSLAALPADEGAAWQEKFTELQSTGRATLVLTAHCSLPTAHFLVATERLPLVRAIWPEAQARPEVTIPPGVRRDWPREEAIAYLLRGRLECVGPVTAAALANTLTLPLSEVESGLITLENQGIVLRGQFTGAAELEWCERRLLARIHRLTLDGLRRQIAPASPEQYVRFLTRYLHARPQSRRRGQAGLLALLEQLEGFEAPAGHWEKYLLPARIEDYDPSWLDSLTFFGQVGWGRLRAPSSMNLANLADGSPAPGRPIKALTRSTPISLMLRDHLPWLLPAAEENPALAPDSGLGSNARAAFEAFLRHGALFPAQLGSLLQLLPGQVDDVLGELAAAGLVTSDGYPALRTLIGASLHNSQRRARRSASALAIPAGRWTLLRSALTPAVAPEERINQWCRLLLRRYGIMFRDLLANESAAPPWGELVRTYRRLEARGEIRGGRFVSGVAGEQFALPEAIPLLRAAANEADDPPLTLPASDPLNLSGRIFSNRRVPALPGQFIVVAEGTVRVLEPPARPGTQLAAVGRPQKEVSQMEAR